MKNPRKLALLLPWLLLALSCGSTGGGEFEDLCDKHCTENFACVPEIDVVDLCTSECVQDFEKADKFDGVACIDAKRAMFTCLDALVCTDRNEFMAADLRKSEVDGNPSRLEQGNFICDISTPLVDCCELELLALVDACPRSFDFAAGE